MAQVSSKATSKVLGLLAAPTGLGASLANLELREGVDLGDIGEEQLIGQRVASEIAERSPGVRYPAAYVYCEKLENLLTEKFRRFSGKAHMVIELRATQDRMEELEKKLQLYVEGVTEVLENNRGDLGDGLFYGGQYVVEFGAVKHGGKNFLQGAKVLVVLDVSLS